MCKFFALSDDDKEWILDYLCSVKGKKILSLKLRFYRMTEFYSSLKNKIIKPAKYKNVKKKKRKKKNWQKMRIKKLLDLNHIYNFQGTTILWEIFENRTNQMMNRFPYNPRKCLSASSLSGCIHRFLSKTIIALPTKAEIVQLFEQTLIGGFSCVNTRLSFNWKIFVPEGQRK